MTQWLILSTDVQRALGISPLRIKHLAEFFSGRSWPKICPRIFFFGFFEKFETFFSKICPHSERYRNLSTGIFEIRTFVSNVAFPLSPVILGRFFLKTKHFSGRSISGHNKLSSGIAGVPHDLRVDLEYWGAGFDIQIMRCSSGPIRAG